MGETLIVANQTLGGAKLDRVVRERIERGNTRFHLLVPMALAAHEAPDWSGGFALGRSLSHPYVVGPHEGIAPEQAAREAEEYARRQESMLEDARERAHERLALMLARIRSLGGEADGEVGDANPTAAVERILAHRSFEEIIISTLPARISRWLRMNLSSRVSRMTDTPVTTIEAEA